MDATIKRLSNYSSINDVIPLVTGKRQWVDMSLIPQWPGDPLKREWTIISLDEARLGATACRTYTTYASAIVEKRASWTWRNDDGSIKSHDAITYPKGCIVQFIELNNEVFVVFGSKSPETLAAVIDNMMPENKWGALVPATKFQVQDDFFKWIVYRWLEGLQQITKNMSLLAVTNFKSHVIGETQKVTGDGDSLDRIPATLSVIYEDNNLEELQIDLLFNSERLRFSYNMAGSINFKENDYAGSLVKGYDGKPRFAIIIALIYIVIIPTLHRIYRKEIKENKWTEKKLLDFQMNIGFKLLDMVLPRLVSDLAYEKQLNDILCRHIKRVPLLVTEIADSTK